MNGLVGFFTLRDIEGIFNSCLEGVDCVALVLRHGCRCCCRGCILGLVCEVSWFCGGGGRDEGVVSDAWDVPVEHVHVCIVEVVIGVLGWVHCEIWFALVSDWLEEVKQEREACRRTSVV